MRNTAPIFLLGLQRGGTNQLLNVLRSHPDTYWPTGELHAVYRPRGVAADGAVAELWRVLRYAPLVATSGDFLNPHRPPRLPSLAGWRGRWLDRTLLWASRTNAPEVKAYKAALAAHGLIDDDGPPPSRLVVKLVNYNVALLDALARLYPDARFVGLVRDPFALAESRLARGTPLDAAMAVYAFVEQIFAAAEAAGAPLRVVRFEDLLAAPEATMRLVLDACGLDAARMRGVCLQNKTRVADATGRVVRFTLSDGYYAFEDVQNHMRADVNTTAVSRLCAAQKDEIGRLCAAAIERRGYRSPDAGPTEQDRTVAAIPEG